MLSEATSNDGLLHKNAIWSLLGLIWWRWAIINKRFDWKLAIQNEWPCAVGWVAVNSFRWLCGERGRHLPASHHQHCVFALPSTLPSSFSLIVFLGLSLLFHLYSFPFLYFYSSHFWHVFFPPLICADKREQQLNFAVMESTAKIILIIWNLKKKAAATLYFLYWLYYLSILHSDLPRLSLDFTFVTNAV